LKKKHISIFDLDHTLLSINSSFYFGLYLYRRKKLPLLKLLYAASCYSFHKCGLMSLEKLHHKVFYSLFKGIISSQIKPLVDSFLAEHLSQSLYPPAIKMLQQAQNQNHFIAILSSSPDFLVGPISKLFGAHQWCGTLYGVDENKRFSHVSKLIHGKEKARYVSQIIDELDLLPCDVTAYSDSHLDLPFLQAVGNAVGVNPDNILRRACRENRWKII
jgi:HAD superfamily hydrolase (TIGR01490 family)